MTTNHYLELLSKRAESKTVSQDRAVLCLDPSRMVALDKARDAFMEAQRNAPQVDGQGRKPAVKRSAVDQLRAAHKAVLDAEEAAREASIWVVLNGLEAGEVLAAHVKGNTQEQNQKAVIVAAFDHAESVVDNTVIPEITREVFAEFFPAMKLASGELGVLTAALNVASAGPDFPTSPRL